MLGFRSEKTSRDKQGLKYKFIIIESLVFILPLLVLFYIFYQRNISFDSSHLFLLAMIVLLMLSGLIILRHVFEGFSSIGEMVKRAAEAGEVVSIDIRKDVAELDEISTSFMHCMKKFEIVTDDLNRKKSELKALKELAELVGKTLDIDALLNIILDKAMELKRAKMGSVFIVDHDMRQLRLVGMRGIDDFPEDSFINVDASLLKHVVTERKPFLVQDIENDPRTLKTNDPRYGAPSFLSMPVFAGNELTAVLTLAHKETGEVFDASDEEILSIMLAETRFALENALLHSRAEAHVKEIEERNIALEQEIAERKRTEEKLVNTLRELQEAKDMVVQSEKLAAIGQLTAGVAHEILNPVNNMSMRMQLLSLSGTLSPEVENGLKDCEEEIGRIVEITKNLGQFSRITGKDNALIDLNQLIEGVLNLMAPRFLVEGIIADVSLREDFPKIPLDKTRIEQVLMNIISNAADAMEGQKNKLLSIRTDLERSQSDDRAFVICTVSDSGIGIKEDDFYRIFDPFYTTKGMGKGTGLGLSIAYGIIQDHGGTIVARNRATKGATFVIKLPVADDHVSESE